VTVDPSGNLVIADQTANQVLVIPVASGTFYGQAMTANHVYTIAGTGTPGSTGDAGAATAAELDGPTSVAFGPSGNLVIADAQNNRIQLLAVTSGTYFGQAMTANDIYTIAGTGTPGSTGAGGAASAAELNDPTGVVVRSSGNVVIADTANNRVQTIPITTGTFYGQAMTANDIYTIAGNGTPGSTGDAGAATAAELDSPTGLAVDTNGNVVIADTGNDRLQVIAGATATYYGQAMTADDIYTIAGTGTPGSTGVGGAATAAGLDDPTSVVSGPSGNLVIADALNNRVQVLALTTGTFFSQAMTANHVYTIAGSGTVGSTGNGGAATAADLDDPTSIVFGPSGNLIIADAQNNRIQALALSTGTFWGQAMTTGDVYTIAASVGASPTGYLESASDGGIFSFAPAGVNPEFYGSMGGKTLDQPVVGIASDPHDGGYLEVASDGGIFSFAPPGVNPDFYGSMGGKTLDKPVVGIAYDPHDGGYLEVASDGGIFSFAPPGVNPDFYGSMGGKTLDKPVVGIAVTGG
jgi:hypothetical protein